MTYSRRIDGRRFHEKYPWMDKEASSSFKKSTARTITTVEARQNQTPHKLRRKIRQNIHRQLVVAMKDPFGLHDIHDDREKILLSYLTES